MSAQGLSYKEHKKISKPDFQARLDHVGPMEVIFLGVDKSYGFLVGDQQNAISCHLKAKAQE